MTAEFAERLSAIPAELIALPQWVGWRYEVREGKQTKVPISPRRGTRADTTDSLTWATYEEACAFVRASNLPGIGFVFAKGGGIIGIDLDKCRDAATGLIVPEAAAILTALNSYSEASPSETGVHTIVRGVLPEGGHKRQMGWGGAIEMYDAGRFFTMTGDALNDTPGDVCDAQGAVDALHAAIFPPKEQSTSTSSVYRSESSLEDAEVIERATRANNGTRFTALMDGDTSGNGGDHSGADLALCGMLMFWTGNDKAQTDRIFRGSGLMRSKWNEGRGQGTYGEMTLEKAVQTETYSGPGKAATYTRGRPTPINPNVTIDDDQANDGGEGGRTYTATGECFHRINAADQRLYAVTRAAWEAIVASNDPPMLFQFDGEPVRLARDARHQIDIQPLTDERLRHEAAERADWYAPKIIKTRGGETTFEAHAKPPKDVITNMLAAPKIPLPPLTRVVEVPSYTVMGELIETPGYHPGSGIYYEPATGLAMEPVPSNPTDADLAEALAVIDDLLCDFPFADGDEPGNAERAAAIALLIVPFVREMIAGATPLHLIEAPKQGTGKGLLAQVLTYPFAGESVAMYPEIASNDEMRKSLTSAFREGRSHIGFDNLTEKVKSSALSMALTEAWWSDRLLGVNKTARHAIRCVWFATANNTVLDGDAIRRSIRIRLDAGLEHPEDRRGFRHADLATYMKANRGKIIAATLTLCQSWIANGRKRSKKTLGSYGEYVAIVGGILENAGIGGFLDNLTSMRDAADTEGAPWRELIAAWWGGYSGAGVTAGELYKLTNDIIGFDFGRGDEQGKKTSFGKQLSQKRDNIISGYRIEDAEKNKSVRMYRLMPIE